MKFRKTISLLTLCIIILSFIAASYGILSDNGNGQYEYKSIHGKTISIYGKGLYKNDSVSVASQAIAQDIVTIILGIPLLIISLYLSRKGLIKGRLLLTGTLGYFLYTYTSYSFLSMYNSLFLIYVMLMSLSFFAFTLAMMSFDIQDLSLYFDEKLPVKFLGCFLIFIAFSIGMMWLGRIVPSLINNTLPNGLEHYATLVIQALDLGFLVPTGIISGILVIKKKAIGYLLASVVIIKSITMLSAITAMIIGQIHVGIKVNFVEIVLFPLFNLLVIYCMTLIMKSVKEPRYE
ncbi:hypothetical protein [Caloranaerobacter azorensis]|uniref:hypothetical protein n=1 Tax=Caloranaerobacter azorensis TaxID=116090 RepID=UPI000B32209D|nr:hypothetical protein [Caloranaerobacter azorensis]